MASPAEASTEAAATRSGPWRSDRSVPATRAIASFRRDPREPLGTMARAIVTELGSPTASNAERSLGCILKPEGSVHGREPAVDVLPEWCPHVLGIALTQSVSGNAAVAVVGIPALAKRRQAGDRPAGGPTNRLARLFAAQCCRHTTSVSRTED